jgi:hypothetical protein
MANFLYIPSVATQHFSFNQLQHSQSSSFTYFFVKLKFSVDKGWWVGSHSHSKDILKTAFTIILKINRIYIEIETDHISLLVHQIVSSNLQLY